MVSFLNYTAFLLINLLKLLLGLLKGLLIAILWSSHNWTGQLFAISLYQPAKGHLPFGTWSSITMSHSPSLDSLLNWDINPMRMSEHLLIPCEIPCYPKKSHQWNPENTSIFLSVLILVPRKKHAMGMIPFSHHHPMLTMQLPVGHFPFFWHQSIQFSHWTNQQ